MKCILFNFLNVFEYHKPMNNEMWLNLHKKTDDFVYVRMYIETQSYFFIAGWGIILLNAVSTYAFFSNFGMEIWFENASKS